MKTYLLENLTLALATIIFGVMAGFFWTYSFNVNIAMLEVDGQTYAQMQSLFNQNVRHPMFFAFFFGGGIASVLAVLTNLKYRKNMSFWLLTSAALIYIIGIIIFTAKVNLPLNYYTESWQLNDIPTDWESTRTHWNNANLVRVAASLSSFILCIFVFVLRAGNKTN